jgi:hypothetical protein
MLTQEQLDDLIYVPKLLGRPVYPGGFPIQPHELEVGTNRKTESIKDRIAQYYKHCFTERGEPLENPSLPEEDFQVLRQWMIYLVHAPAWTLHLTPDFEELKAKTLSVQNWKQLDEVSHLCIEFGLDIL